MVPGRAATCPRKTMKCLSAMLAFAATSVVVAILLGFLASGIETWAAWSAIACGMLAALLAWQATQPQPRAHPGFWDWLMLAAFALSSWRAFFWIAYLRGDEICVLSPNNLGDLSLHLNLIRYLASGVPFWPESSILSHVPLSYPLGADLFNSLLEVCGVDTIRGLVWTGLVGAALTGYALWLWGGAFGVAAFLFNGGLAGFAVLRTMQIDDFQREVVWKNLFLSMFVTQRGLLFALPAGLLLLNVWRERYFRRAKRVVPFWLQFLLYASMPLFNVHAFLFLSCVLLAIFVASFFDAQYEPPACSGQIKSVRLSVRSSNFPRNQTAREVLTLVASAAILAAAGVFLVTGFLSVASGIRWSPGWIAGQAGGNIWVWMWNFGLTLPLCMALVVALFFDRDLEARCFVWTASVLFATCCLFVFAPWEWDNMKLMLWSWLVIAPYLWRKMLAPLSLAARGAVCLVLFFSGGISLVGGLDARHGYAIARRSELDAWRHAIADIPSEARFACVPDYNHPLILLGRKAACGYEGHLWSHGLDYQEKFALLKSSLIGDVIWRISAPILDVEWLALRKEDFPAAKPPGISPAIESYGGLYDLRPLLRQDPSSPRIPQLRPRSVD
jgi:hypothetical protein